MLFVIIDGIEFHGSCIVFCVDWRGGGRKCVAASIGALEKRCLYCQRQINGRLCRLGDECKIIINFNLKIFYFTLIFFVKKKKKNQNCVKEFAPAYILSPLAAQLDANRFNSFSSMTEIVYVF